MKNENNSSKRIHNYLLKNLNILSSKEKKLMINYLTQILKYDIENKKDETIEDIISDLKFLIQTTSKMENTSVNRKRIHIVLKLVEDAISSHATKDKRVIKYISNELDKLYIDLDLPPRKNSSFSYYLEDKGLKR